jgi:hypothetical protein
VHSYGQCSTQLLYSVYVVEVLSEEFVHLRCLNIHNMASSRLIFTNTGTYTASIHLLFVTQYFPFISQPNFKHVWFVIFYFIACHFYLCNKNQLVALFILNLFCQATCTCFLRIYCPSSGGILCICTAVGTWPTAGHPSI